MKMQIAICFGAAVVALAAVTYAGMRPLPPGLTAVAGLESASRVPLLARGGERLSTAYHGSVWNQDELYPLHAVPTFLQRAFIASEDRRFYTHSGIDWRARGAAFFANIRHGRAVRGASTITEQVVRMLHPRPRSIWSRWLEGFEAMRLEQQASKAEILEFYLNQVPFANERRGIGQAARYYFNRKPDTLSEKEMMALAVLVRAPSRMDLFRGTETAEAAITRLNAVLGADIAGQPLALQKPGLDVSAPHFVSAARQQGGFDTAPNTAIHTTLDATLQGVAQSLLDGRLKALRGMNLRHGALLVVDHTTGDVLAWAVGDNHPAPSQRTLIDAVTTPRQPGSALKPFLYATALEKGWTPATQIDDAPLLEMVGAGLHPYQNYSRKFYGPVTLRQALGNSLNIPALKTLQFVGGEDYLAKLRQAGFSRLERHPDLYGDGLALGNGEVSLFELVQAYATLANKGRFQPLHLLAEPDAPHGGRQVFNEKSASLIGDILSDPHARELEFGASSVLNLPVQTAAKTGTSSDYRDAWALGYNYRYVVGVWMGNLDQTPTDGITGSTGPSLLLRSVFAELTRHAETRPLYLSPQLAEYTLCRETYTPPTGAAYPCTPVTEWFDPAFPPGLPPATAQHQAIIRLRQPTPGLHMAYDPRIPAHQQQFAFILQGTEPGDEIRWTIDGERVTGYTPRYLWPVSRGKHTVSAEVLRGGEKLADVPSVTFTVK